MKSEDDLPPEDNQAGRRRSRRELLRSIIATGGGAVTLSTLPTRWESPRVEAGVLPILAQLSSLTIADFSATIVGGAGTLACGAGNFPVDYVVDYNDPAGGLIPAQARIRLFVNGILDVDTALLASDMSSGDQFSGRLRLPFCFNFAGTSVVTITIQLVNSSKTVSNSLSALLTNPSPVVTTADDPNPPTMRRRINE